MRKTFFGAPYFVIILSLSSLRKFEEWSGNSKMLGIDKKCVWGTATGLIKLVKNARTFPLPWAITLQESRYFNISDANTVDLLFQVVTQGILIWNFKPSNTYPLLENQDRSESLVMEWLNFLSKAEMLMCMVFCVTAQVAICYFYRTKQLYRNVKK